MATFFGEVVSAFSRAVEEDDEEDEEEEEEDREIRKELEKKREVVVSWSTETAGAIERSPEKRLPCSDFILAIGDNPTGFVSSYILSSGSWELAGSIRCRDIGSQNDSPTASSSCTFYRSTMDEVLLCLCNCYVAEDQLFQWCGKVFGCLQKTKLQVTVLSACPVSDYKTTESTHNLPVPFLKALKTKLYTERTLCSPMEQPNIADSLPAAVLTYCQVWEIPAVLYQCYTDITRLDSITVKAFSSLLPSLKTSHLAADSADIKEILKKTLKDHEIQSNLYI
ncbi:proteasome assembly chaperone 1 isoform 2-T2 [Pelodytes ibericus]